MNYVPKVNSEQQLEQEKILTVIFPQLPGTERREHDTKNVYFWSLKVKCAAWQGEKHQNLVTSFEGGKCEFKYTKYQISTGTKVNPCVSRQGMMKSSLSIGGTPPRNSSFPLLQCTMYWTQLILTCWERENICCSKFNLCSLYSKTMQERLWMRFFLRTITSLEINGYFRSRTKQLF